MLSKGKSVKVMVVLDAVLLVAGILSVCWFVISSNNKDKISVKEIDCRNYLNRLLLKMHIVVVHVFR